MNDIQRSCLISMELLLEGCKRNQRDMVAVNLTQPALEIIVQALHSIGKVDALESEVKGLRDNYEKINNPWGDRWEYSNPYDAVLKLFGHKQEDTDGR